jgi:serpin B
MKTIKYFLALIAICFMMSCKTIVKTNNSTITSENHTSLSNSENVDVIKDGQMTQENSMTEFSFEIFKQVSLLKPEENISFSPASLNIAMGMVYSGARNSTASEISTVMGYNPNREIFLKSFSTYLKYLNDFSTDSEVEFNLANRIFLEKDYLIRDDYRELIKLYFDGAFQNVDFRNNFKIEEKKINSWVSEMTRKRINNLIPEGTLTDETRMVLVNAIFIKSKWKFPFTETTTSKKDFFVNNNETAQTDFMIQREKGFGYADFDGIQVLEMPYTSPELSLIVILPHDSNSENISKYIPVYAQYEKICQNLRFSDVYVEIPKFKTESSFKLADILIEMGVKSAFETADFSGITDYNNLAISEVIQKVFFEVDEKGSEAAAATAVIMYETSSVQNIEFDNFESFIANRPFIYILKEKKYNTPLFVGLYVNPN